MNDKRFDGHDDSQAHGFGRGIPPTPAPPQPEPRNSAWERHGMKKPRKYPSDWPDGTTDPEDDDQPDDDTEAGFEAMPDMGKRIEPEPANRPGVRGKPEGMGHNTSSLLSGQREGMRLDFQGPLPPETDPRLVTARGVFGQGTGPIGSSVNENPGAASVVISDHAAAAAGTMHAPAVAGMRAAHRRLETQAPLSPSNTRTSQGGRTDPCCTPPPSCQ